MIRQDKITFLISTLENVEIYNSSFNYNYYVHNNPFNSTEYSDRIFKRLGIISKTEKNSSKLLTQYLPVNKHDFLNKTLKKFSSDYCLKDLPLCNDCFFDKCCDYYNKKNDWLEWKKI